VKVGGGAGDTVAGLFAAFGTMTALWHARETGQGQYVDVAMTDSILALSELVVSQFSYRGVSPVPMGNGIPGMSPFGTIKVKDGVIAIAAPHDPQWRVLCELIGAPHLATDPRFINEATRWEHRDAITEALEAFTLTQTKDELRALLGGRVPFSPIYTAQDIFADPHFSVRQMLPEVEQPGSARPVAVPGVPVKLSQTPGGVRHRAPLLGEHSRDILAELGLAGERIDALIQSGAISTQ
jgi:crotonobetainyl-CoA:carnitine CoA-transferase CaiB-like acyl-CoA transferase